MRTSFRAQTSSSLPSLAMLRIRKYEERKVDAVCKVAWTSCCTAWYGSIDMSQRWRKVAEQPSTYVMSFFGHKKSSCSGVLPSEIGLFANRCKRSAILTTTVILTTYVGARMTNHTSTSPPCSRHAMATTTTVQRAARRRCRCYIASPPSPPLSP